MNTSHHHCCLHCVGTSVHNDRQKSFLVRATTHPTTRHNLHHQPQSHHPLRRTQFERFQEARDSFLSYHVRNEHPLSDRARRATSHLGAHAIPLYQQQHLLELIHQTLTTPSHSPRSSRRRCIPSTTRRELLSLDALLSLIHQTKKSPQSLTAVQGDRHIFQLRSPAERVGIPRRGPASDQSRTG